MLRSNNGKGSKAQGVKDSGDDGGEPHHPADSKGG
jgi:hypothetical protein